MTENPIPPYRDVEVGGYTSYIIIVAAIISVAATSVIIVIPLAQTYLSQPVIVPTDIGFTKSGCGVFTNTTFYTYNATFTLVNTGGASGFASTNFVLNGTVTLESNLYYVPANSQVTKTWSIAGPNCNANSLPSLDVVKVTKA